MFLVGFCSVNLSKNTLLPGVAQAETASLNERSQRHELDSRRGRPPTMTRDELIESIAKRTKMSRPQAESLVWTIFDSMEQSLRQGQRIEIRGFGTFQVRSYKGYRGRNPRTGTPVEVAPKRLPFFKVSKNLAAEVNGGRDSSSARRRRDHRLLGRVSGGAG